MVAAVVSLLGPAPSAIALKMFPTFNSSLDLASNQLVLKEYYHVGVAVDTKGGLLVPVIRDVDKKSVEQLAKELTETGETAQRPGVPGSPPGTVPLPGPPPCSESVSITP